MLILLSPAKTMTGTSKIKAPQGTTPRFQQEANEIALHMTQFPIDELSRILKLSPKLAAECYRRYQDFHAEDNQPLQAILAYTGVVFKNISPKDFTEEDFLFSQEHMRFVSGCYGLLRPLDLIKPLIVQCSVPSLVVTSSIVDILVIWHCARVRTPLSIECNRRRTCLTGCIQ